MRRLFILAAALCSAAAAALNPLVPAANYYVDGSRGSDSNDGSLRYPFLTVTKGLSVAASGNLIAVYGGPSCTSRVTYREQATVPAGVMLTGFGGCAPLLDASDAISAGAWSKTGGYTNIYQATVTTAQASGVGFLCVWESNVCGANFPYVSSLAALDAATNGFYVANQSNITGTSQTVYVHATGGGNPASNGLTYEYSARLYGAYSALADAVKVSNIDTRRNLHNDGSLVLGSGSYAYNVNAKEGAKHNAIIHGSSTYRAVTLTDSYYAGQSKIALVAYDDAPAGADVVIDSPTYTETVETTGTAFFGHAGSGIFGRILLRNATTTGAASSVSGFAADSMVISGGTFNAGIATGSTTNTITGATVGGQIQIPYTSTVEIGSVTMSFSQSNGLIRIGTGSTVTPSVYIHDCDFSNGTAFDGAIYVNTNSTPAAFRIESNIFRAPVQTNHIGGPGAANLPVGSIFANNVYHYPGATSWIVYRGTTYSLTSAANWTAWQAIEATATKATP